MKKGLIPPISWYGGKTRFAKKLISVMPDHKTYVEVFAGSAALLFAKEPTGVEVINDLHSGLVNFYRVIRDPGKFRKFGRLINLTPFSRQEFAFCRDTWAYCEDDVERAYRWFVMIRQSYGSVGRSFGRCIKDGRNGVATNVKAYLSAISRLPEIHNRLNGVQVDMLDFREAIAKYDAPTTLFYLDPPYVHSTRKSKAYDHEMSDQDHEALMDILLSIEGNAILSGYANPIYERLEEAGWTRIDHMTSCPTANRYYSEGNGSSRRTKEDNKRVESVWLNYDVPAACNEAPHSPTPTVVSAGIPLSAGV
jgi:DNA adenine methylase